VVLFKIMLPYMWVILILALCMGVLNATGNFGIPAVAPILLNLGIIIAALFIAPCLETPVLGLAWGVILGGAGQLALQLPFVFQKAAGSFSRFVWWHPGVILAFKQMVPCMIGAASYQINLLVATLFASFLAPGTIASFYFADRLVQFPLALLATSFSTVFLPFLSRTVVAGRIDRAGAVFGDGARMVIFVTIPAMAGILALDRPIVTLLFSQGAFDNLAVQRTAGCLFYLVLGLWAYTGHRLFVTFHHAQGQVALPLAAGLTAIAVNLIFCRVLIGPMGVQGLALAVSVAGAAGFGVLLFFTSGTGFKRDLAVSACRSLFLSAIMYLLLQKVQAALLMGSYSKAGLCAGILVCVFLGGMFFFLAGTFLAAPEIEMIKQVLIKRKEGNDPDR
jgi:putative peptidoglycan lipid II flippase